MTGGLHVCVEKCIEIVVFEHIIYTLYVIRHMLPIRTIIYNIYIISKHFLKEA